MSVGVPITPQTYEGSTRSTSFGRLRFDLHASWPFAPKRTTEVAHDGNNCDYGDGPDYSERQVNRFHEMPPNDVTRRLPLYPRFARLIVPPNSPEVPMLKTGKIVNTFLLPQLPTPLKSASRSSICVCCKMVQGVSMSTCPVDRPRMSPGMGGDEREIAVEEREIRVHSDVF